MRLQVLICTANQEIYNIKKIILDEKKNVNYLISHQLFKKSAQKFNIERKDIEYYQIKSKGLSKNRNNAILYSSGDICLVADDDVLYKEEFFDRIIETFEKNPEADIITFKIKTNQNEPEFRKYPDKPYWHTIFTLFSVSSIEIAFRLSSIKEKGLLFDENFGVGSKFIGGEENIFLIDALRRGLKIRYEPYFIVQHSYETNALKLKFSKNYIQTTGAKNYRIFGFWAFFIGFFSALKNYRLYRLRYKFYEFLKFFYQGCFIVRKILRS